MEFLNPMVIFLIILGAAAGGVALYWLYTTISNLYQDFVHFSRRFRGVE